MSDTREAFRSQLLEAWQRRSQLQEETIPLLFLDGIYLGVRGNSRDKEGMLVAHGITHEGRRVVRHLSFGGSMPRS